MTRQLYDARAAYDKTENQRRGQEEKWHVVTDEPVIELHGVFVPALRAWFHRESG
jgi:hypothetical protein